MWRKLFGDDSTKTSTDRQISDAELNLTALACSDTLQDEKLIIIFFFLSDIHRACRQPKCVYLAVGRNGGPCAWIAKRIIREYSTWFAGAVRGF